MADSNPYRRGTGIKYKNSSLTVRESEAFLGRINKRGERKCIAMVKNWENEDVVCGRKFISEGYHNRKCTKCSTREEHDGKSNKNRDLLVHRTHASGVRSTAFHAEVGE